MYRSFIKPFFDFVFALTLTLLVFPIGLVITFLLFIEHNGRVFFVQERAKQHGLPFRIIKFRTLTEVVGDELKDEKLRITHLGNFLRATSLDELPQLINVLKGDMSLIGPRPLYVYYNEKYNETHKQRLLVKPGMTGWAQVHGGNRLTWSQKFDLDVWYVKKCDFFLDINILFKTISYLLFNIDLLSNSHINVHEFNGDLKTKK